MSVACALHFACSGKAELGLTNQFTLQKSHSLTKDYVRKVLSDATLVEAT